MVADGVQGTRGNGGPGLVHNFCPVNVANDNEPDLGIRSLLARAAGNPLRRFALSGELGRAVSWWTVPDRTTPGNGAPFIWERTPCQRFLWRNHWGEDDNCLRNKLLQN